MSLTGLFLITFLITHLLGNFQLLVDEELVEKKRGLGMYVVSGAKAKLGKLERSKFLQEEWPTIVERIQRLGLEPGELLGTASVGKSKTDGADE